MFIVHRKICNFKMSTAPHQIQVLLLACISTLSHRATAERNRAKQTVHRFIWKNFIYCYLKCTIITIISSYFALRCKHFSRSCVFDDADQIVGVENVCFVFPDAVSFPFSAAYPLLPCFPVFRFGFLALRQTHTNCKYFEHLTANNIESDACVYEIILIFS